MVELLADKKKHDNNYAWNGWPEGTYSLLDKKEDLLPQSKAADILADYNSGLAFDQVTQKWLQYAGKYWKEITDTAANRMVTKWIKAGLDDTTGYSYHYLMGLMNLLKIQLAADGFDDNLKLVPFTNGVLDLNAGTLLRHSPDLKILWCLPFDYNPAATCEPVIAWLTECVKGDALQVELLRAYIKAVITGRYDLQRYLEVIGPGGSGKGTFQRLCTALVGTRNVHITELKHLENNRFETARLHRKRLCILTDAEKYTGDVSILKAMTGCDNLRYEEKHKQGGGSFRFQGLVLIGANQEITSSDLTSGLQRRRITVRFDNQVAPGARRDLETEFQPYLSGVVAWALALDDDRMKALLVETDKYVPTVGRFSHETLIQVNSLAAWADEHLILDPKVETPVGVKKPVTLSTPVDDGHASQIYIDHADEWLFASYAQWCRNTGSKEVALRRFTPLLLDLLRNQLKVLRVEKLGSSNGKPNRFKGIRLRTKSDALIEGFLASTTKIDKRLVKDW